MSRSHFRALVIRTAGLVAMMLAMAPCDVEAQSELRSLTFESIDELTQAGAVITGSVELVEGVAGSGISLAHSSSACFPAAQFLQAARGTLQFWIKDPLAGGMWEVTSLGTTRKWGGFRETTEGGDNLQYELQTNTGTFARSTRQWSSNQEWHFVVFTWQQGAVRTEFSLSLDGIAGAKPNLLGKVDLTPTSMLCLGRYGALPAGHPSIDELRSYDYVRSTTEIFTEYLDMLPGCPSWPYLWRNPMNGADVDRDGAVTKLDALHVLSALVSLQQFDFLSCPNGTLPMLSYDAFADNRLDNQDANVVVVAANNQLPPESALDINRLRLFTQGDANGDGVLDASDLEFMRQRFGLTGGIFEEGDITGDGKTDETDLAVAHRYLSLSGSLEAVLPRFKVQRAFTNE